MADNRRVMVPITVQFPSGSVPTTNQSHSAEPSVADVDPLIVSMPRTTSISSDLQTQEPTNIPSSGVPVSNEQIPEESTREEPKLRHFYVVDPSTPKPDNPNQFVDPEVVLVECCKS